MNFWVYASMTMSMCMLGLLLLFMIIGKAIVEVMTFDPRRNSWEKREMAKER